MIINKLNKSFQTRSDASNFNWLKSDEWVVVPDNSELANKIMQLFPRFELVLDENDNVVDVVEVPKTEEELNQERIEEIKSELEDFDKIVDRQWEDYYIREGVMPVERIRVVISKKEKLREELNLLTGGELNGI